jgi:uncharacterized protein YpbB
MTDIEVSPQFKQVLDFVNQTNQTIFLTGKAGTGKTTLLRYIRANTFKQMAVVAPTGVAAINAGGTTIHSFFQFAFTPFVPVLQQDGQVDFHASKNRNLSYSSQRLAILRSLELLIIDEVSMVRADLLDQIDITLRQVRRQYHLPFGGVQLLLIGDMFQLPPVVGQEEWSFLSGIYPSPFFFDSVVMRHYQPVYIELTKIYRQKEEAFVNLLNAIRNNTMDAASFAMINERYKPIIDTKDYEENISLTTHNRKADQINAESLALLKTEAFSFKCSVEGLFNEKNYPVDENLVLKKGAKVMFLKNNTDLNYFNGKIGIISYLDAKTIKVKCEGDEADISVETEMWTNVSYKANNETKQIEEEVLGVFSQIPLRYAWAITIHKSQGLTFDKVIIDAAQAFSAGQVYVALSRCRSLAGLTLSSMIDKRSLFNEEKVVKFAKTKQADDVVVEIYQNAHSKYIAKILSDLFVFNDFSPLLAELKKTFEDNPAHINQEGFAWLFDELSPMLIEIAATGGKFKHQLEQLLQAASFYQTDEPLQNRIRKASVYFEIELDKIFDKIKTTPLVTESKETAKELNETLQELLESVFLKKKLMASSKFGFDFNDYTKTKLATNYANLKVNVYASGKAMKAPEQVIYPALYDKLRTLRDTFCEEEDKPIYMVANSKELIELANCLPINDSDLLKITGFGPAKVRTYGPQFLAIIQDFIQENGIESRMLLQTTQKRERKPKVQKEDKVDTKKVSFDLYQQGLSLDEIALKRNFAITTIEGHLVPYIQQKMIGIDALVSKERQKVILEAKKALGEEEGTSALKAALPVDYSYGEIRLTLASI